MRLKLEFSGLEMQLEINNWQSRSDSDEWESNWCDIEFLLKSKYLNHFDKGEILDSSEVEYLSDALEKLVNGSLVEDVGLSFIEPDWVLNLRTAKKDNLSSISTFNRLFCHDDDISADFAVRFWCEGGLTNNCFVFGLDRYELTAMSNYLRYVIGKIKEDDQIIIDMINEGTLIS